jgi:amino acid transporter
MVSAYVGAAILEPELQAQYGITLPWWVFATAMIVLVTFLVYRGVSFSGNAILIFGTIEILIVVALGIWALGSPGPGGFSLAPFDPGNATSLQGLYLGVVFSVFAFTGWEGITPMAEESEDPKRNVPRALIASVLILGAIYVFCSWAYIVGLGTDKITDVATQVENPTFTLANRLWGGAWVILLFALFNSAIAAAVGSFSAATRLWYAMARSGSLPPVMARVHPIHKTPTAAIVVEVVLSFATLLLMLVAGPITVFGVWALVVTLSLILVYCGVNVGVVLFYRTVLRDRFNVVLHLVFPVLATAAVLWVGYNAVYPFPAAPTVYAPMFLGIWILIGIGLLVAYRSQGREEWLLRAGAAMDE